jgi:hypothetical protein
MSHWDAVHTAEPLCGTGQARPHTPQFAGSFVVSTQLPEQALSAPHVDAHEPPAHDSPVAQALPHLPQFAGSLDVSTQALPHCASIPLQLKPHPFVPHVAVADAGTLHTVPQEPQ